MSGKSYVPPFISPILAKSVKQNDLRVGTDPKHEIATPLETCDSLVHSPLTNPKIYQQSDDIDPTDETIYSAPTIVLIEVFA